MLDDGATGQWHAPPMWVPWDLPMRLASCRASWLWQLLLHGITLQMNKLGFLDTWVRCTAWDVTVLPPDILTLAASLLHHQRFRVPAVHRAPGLPPRLLALLLFDGWKKVFRRVYSIGRGVC
jgi:hypothetical protein